MTGMRRQCLRKAVQGLSNGKNKIHLIPVTVPRLSCLKKSTKGKYFELVLAILIAKLR